MLTITPITPSTSDLSGIESLYLTAFPREERTPFAMLLSTAPGNDFLSFREGETLRGFCFAVTVGDLTHILFFAMADGCRDRGFGTQALALLKERYAGQRLLADIEDPAEPGSPNPEQRRRRRQFYLRCGFSVSPVRYVWRGTAYEIVVSGGELTPEEFDHFWDALDQARQREF